MEIKFTWNGVPVSIVAEGSELPFVLATIGNANAPKPVKNAAGAVDAPKLNGAAKKNGTTKDSLADRFHPAPGTSFGELIVRVIKQAGPTKTAELIETIKKLPELPSSANVSNGVRTALRRKNGKTITQIEGGRWDLMPEEVLTN